MEFSREKRSRNKDSPSDSEEVPNTQPDHKFLSQTTKENPYLDLSTANPPPPEPFPSKKPKRQESEYRKLPYNQSSGISLSINSIQEAIHRNDQTSLLISLRSLSSELTMTNDESLATVPIDSLTEVLLFSLNTENAEIVLNGMMCVSFLVDSHHSAITYFVKSGVISVLINKIMNVEYIDVAEYAVKSLERISHEFPGEVLRKSFFHEILPMLEFFDLTVQKKLLGILLNVSKCLLSVEDFRTFLEPCLPFFVSLLQNKVKELSYRNEKTLDILVTILESLKTLNEDERIISALVDQGIIVIVLETFIEFSYLTSKCFKLLSVLCRGSIRMVEDFLVIGLEELKKSLVLATVEGNSLILTEGLYLVNSLLPNENDLVRKEFYLAKPQSIEDLSSTVFPRLNTIYEIITKKNARVLLLDITYTIIQVLSAEHLLKNMTFSSFLSNLLLDKEGSIVKGCLKIINILYEKIPKQVSETFIREGVVHRFKLLKNPENLKNITDEKFSDPFEFEQFLISYRRSRALSEYQELHMPRPRLLSECRDSIFDIKKEIISLSKGLISKHNSCENQSALTVSNTLKDIAGGFLENQCDSKALWEQLIHCINNYSPTAYELSSSNLANSIWNFLACRDQETGNFERVQEFLDLFYVKSAGVNFEKLLKLFLSTFIYLESHIVASKPGSRTLQKRINFHYIPNKDLPKEFSYLDDFFRANEKFSISPDPSCLISTIKSMLKRVHSKEDLMYFKDAIRDELMDVEEDPTSKNLKVSLTIQDSEITENSISEIMGSLSETPVIKFTFFISNEKSFYLSDRSEIFCRFLSSCSKNGLDTENPAYVYLRFINFLFLTISDYPFPLNSYSKFDVSLFNCPKLNSLILKQFSEPLHFARKILPGWMKELPKHSWFLFTYTTRLRILDNYRCISTDLRNPKKKIRVNRSDILEGAKIFMNDKRFLLQGVLEVQFDDEIGTGNGPTLEFFSLLAESIRNLGIWRKSTMLFPCPLSKARPDDYFFIGRVVGKAILDKRYIELPLNPVFWKLVQRKPVTLKDLQLVDSELYKTLQSLMEVYQRYQQDPQYNLYNGVPVEDLHIYFNLPAYETIELVPDGCHTLVNIQNLKTYIDLVAEATLIQQTQVSEFREGLCSIIPLESILGFSPEEIEELVCGCNNDVWDLETLRVVIKPAHGYTENSPNFQNLLILMSEFDSEKKKKFLQFVTGCPRLPLGGFFGLNPALTVVKKEDGDDADRYLPSVMTCQNYLKLPNYSDISVMRKNLLLALEEGHHTFHLS